MPRLRLTLLASSLAVAVCTLTPSLPLRLVLFIAGNSTTISSARWLDFALLEVRGIRYRDALRIDSLTLRL
ncbi:MAG: hypothetical protein EBZ07_09085, partial [Verrucomicrobia bacterium]|nr:hypothetical protein [Verrucomicrobiota bacterium]